MSILEYNMSEVPDLGTVPAGEYELVITNVEAKNDKNGNPGLRPVFGIAGEDAAFDVSSWISLPGPNDDNKTAIRKLNRYRTFLRALGFADDEMESVETEELKGRRVWAHLVEKESDYGTQNEIRSYLPSRA